MTQHKIFFTVLVLVLTSCPLVDLKGTLTNVHVHLASLVLWLVEEVGRGTCMKTGKGNKELCERKERRVESYVGGEEFN